MADPNLTYDGANFLDRVAWRNIAPLVIDAYSRQEPAAQEAALEAFQNRDWRFRPTAEGLVVVVAGQELAAIAWSRVFSSSGLPSEAN